ncbi:MAG: MBL fold metallo-hydrolase RNA specificity domain-containing protein [Chloroflexota bacterium]|nr:MBL fold metallo-hydrolase RNA specificity domain-containing protein [Chloroflexota bacterium]
MVRLTFYGGVGEIGGNKILLEDGDRKLLLDFGFPYQRHKLFYEEYLKPRGGAGLLDPLVMELLPPLEGLYRDDLETPGLWPQFRDRPLYRRLDHVDGILLSHAHLDHSGYISFLKNDIPVYATATTAFITKSIQDSGKSDFDQQVCYFSPTVRDYPSGWGQAACLASGDKQQRPFRIADKKPADLSATALGFWSHGFWEKSTRQKEMASVPLAGHSGSAFNLRCFPVDHSIPGACAWGIETSAGWLIYSGDLRLHGKRAKLTENFLAAAAALQPRALILEGTNLRREQNATEQQVYENALKAITGCKDLVIADFSARDADRLLTFLQIAKDTGRKLVILPKDAYFLKTLRLLHPRVPDIAQEDSLVIYQETLASKYPSLWQRNLCQDYSGKLILAKDVSEAQDRFILCFSFFDLNELPSIRPRPGSRYVFSSSEPHNEEQELDFRRLHQWLKHFNIQGFGVPVEVNGEWQVPESERGLHASGHACGPDLLRIARELKPTTLIPVHSEHAADYVERLSGMEVILPALGKTIEIS